MTVIPIIIQQHVEEAGLLWLRRDHAVGEPHYSLDDLAKLDDQLDAHLDGMRVAGQPAWEICLAELRWEEPGEVFPAAVMAFESNDSERIQRVLDVSSGSYELSRPLISALGWFDYDEASKHISWLLDSQDPTLCRMGLAAAAVHRTDPELALPRCLADRDSLLQARALRAVGELGRVDLLPEVQARLRCEDAHCAFWAAWTCGLLTADAEAIDLLRTAIQSGGAQVEPALHVLLRRLPGEESACLIEEMADDPQLARYAVIGAGVAGNPEFIPWLIDRMRIPDLARVAGEALTAISGLDLEQQPFGGEWPQGYEAGPTEDPEDENVEMDLDENLPWPDAESIRRWWQENCTRFHQGVRYLLGQPRDSDWLQKVLGEGRQRHRKAAALELAIQTPGSTLFETRAPGFRQKRFLLP